MTRDAPRLSNHFDRFTHEDLAQCRLATEGEPARAISEIKI
jgi:hypothetical protein